MIQCCSNMSWLLKKINRLQDLAGDLWIFAATVFFCFIFFSFFFWFGFCFLFFFWPQWHHFGCLFDSIDSTLKKKTALFIVHKIVKKKSPPKKITRSLPVLHKSAHGNPRIKKKKDVVKKKKILQGPHDFSIPRRLPSSKRGAHESEMKKKMKRKNKKNKMETPNGIRTKRAPGRTQSRSHFTGSDVSDVVGSLIFFFFIFFVLFFVSFLCVLAPPMETGPKRKWPSAAPPFHEWASTEALLLLLLLHLLLRFRLHLLG